jgi:hypothetical protein
MEWPNGKQARCPVCKKEFGGDRTSSLINTLLFLVTEYLPEVLKREAYMAIWSEFDSGCDWVRAHVDCCFDIVKTRAMVPQRAERSTNVVFRVVGKKS